jgi:hypothetical protein
MGNQFKQHYDILISGFESHPYFGLDLKYSWPYSNNDAQDLILNTFALRSSSSKDILDWVEKVVEFDEDFRLFRLTSKEMSPNPTNLFDQVIYNKNNLVIKNWSSGIIITSAIFYLVRS